MRRFNGKLFRNIISCVISAVTASIVFLRGAKMAYSIMQMT